MALDLGIDFDRLTSELGNDLGDVFDKVAGQARGGLERVANIAQNTGTGLERIAPTGGGVNPLARIAAYGDSGGNTLGNIANYGGGGGDALDFFDSLGGSDPFASFNRASMYAASQPEQAPEGRPGVAGGAGVGATGADPNTDKWRDLIDQAGAANGVDGDIIQAIMMIESGGNEGAVSAAGAQGLMQVMPFHFQPGENGMDPRTNVMKGAKVLADNYKRWGDWNKAVAAYLGAIDGSGNIAGGDPYTGVSGNEYVRRFNENLQRIKAARATKPGGGAGYAGSAQGVASIFGGTVPPIGQGFNEHIPSLASVYDFGTEMGMDGDGHTGWDISVGRGTQFYMPAGLTGKVTIAGGSGFYTTNSGDGAGKGELRILLSNGYELILGHNDRIDVTVGQTVTAGQLLGLTGSSGGDHLHIEVRRPDPSTPSKWRIIDPAELFGPPR